MRHPASPEAASRSGTDAGPADQRGSRRNRAIDTPAAVAGANSRGDIDEAAHHRDLARAAVERVAQVGIAAGAQQALGDAQQAVQRGQVQRAEAARILRVERDVLVEQAFDAGQHHVLVAGGAGFGARAEQQQQRGDVAGGDRVGFGAGEQQGVEQRHQPRPLARGEAEQRRAVQRRQALRVAAPGRWRRPSAGARTGPAGRARRRASAR